LVEPIEFFNPGIPLISFLISFGTASLLVGGGGVRYGDSIGESPMTRQPAVPNVQNRTDLVLTICKMSSRTRHERRWTIAAAAVARGKEAKGYEPSIVVVVRTAGRPLNKEGRAPH
jgi:hypothetical protein